MLCKLSGKIYEEQSSDRFPAEDREHRYIELRKVKTFWAEEIVHTQKEVQKYESPPRVQETMYDID